MRANRCDVRPIVCVYALMCTACVVRAWLPLYDRCIPLARSHLSEASWFAPSHIPSYSCNLTLDGKIRKMTCSALVATPARKPV